MKKERVDLCEVLRQLCAELIPQMDQAGFRYEFDIPEESVYALLDSDRLGRIVQNLAGNALRYNPPGTTVSVSLSAKAGKAVVTFRDDGVGIPEHLREDIFKPFVRVDSARRAQTGGSGLGLSIARRIAQAHGGDLSLQSGEVKGTAFAITLPTI